MNHKYRVERGEIIRILYNDYPHFIKCKILEASLLGQGYRVIGSTIKGHITYLADGGYVEKKELEECSGVRLTKKGVDLYEENIDPDPGIEI